MDSDSNEEELVTNCSKTQTTWAQVPGISQTVLSKDRPACAYNVEEPRFVCQAFGCLAEFRMAVRSYVSCVIVVRGHFHEGVGEMDEFVYRMTGIRKCIGKHLQKLCK